MAGRISRQKKTIKTMIEMFCRDRHDVGATGGSPLLCRECRELLDYASKKLDQCPFQERKPTCAKCTVHCYNPNMRRKVREVMRHSGPLMPWHHPILAFHHLLDGRRKSKGDIKNDRRT